MRSSTGDDNDLMIQLQSGAVSAIYLPALVAASGQFFALAPHMLVAVPRPAHRRPAPQRQGLGVHPRRAAPAFPRGRRQAPPRGSTTRPSSLESDAVKMMKDNGLVVHDPPAAALARWREAANQAVDQLLGTVFSKEIYDQIAGYVQDYRKSPWPVGSSAPSTPSKTHSPLLPSSSSRPMLLVEAVARKVFHTGIRRLGDHIRRAPGACGHVHRRGHHLAGEKAPGAGHRYVPARSP